MYGQNPKDALYAALMRGDYSAITEDPRIPVENPRVVPLGLEQMMLQQQSAMEPEMTSRGINQGYGQQMPLSNIENGRGMVSQATQAGDAVIPQRTNEYKIDAPTFAAAFRRMAELGAPEGVNFTWYVNGKPVGLYKYEYAKGAKRPAAKSDSKKENLLPKGYNVPSAIDKKPAQSPPVRTKNETNIPNGRMLTWEEKYPGVDPMKIMYDWNPAWKEGLKSGMRAAGFYFPE